MPDVFPDHSKSKFARFLTPFDPPTPAQAAAYYGKIDHARRSEKAALAAKAHLLGMYQLREWRDEGQANCEDFSALRRKWKSNR